MKIAEKSLEEARREEIERKRAGDREILLRVIADQKARDEEKLKKARAEARGRTLEGAYTLWDEKIVPLEEIVEFLSLDPEEVNSLFERKSKKKAIAMFDTGFLNDLPAGKFSTLQAIHKYLFEDIYDFAGEMRTVNISKDGFRFASAIYLEDALKKIDDMPQSNLEEIIKKYVEMNVAHPFRDGNGRSMRIWLDHILKTEIGKVVDWIKAEKPYYLRAMERSPFDDNEIKYIIAQALTERTEDREVFLRGLDCSFDYEDYSAVKARDL